MIPGHRGAILPHMAADSAPGCDLVSRRSGRPIPKATRDNLLCTIRLFVGLVHLKHSSRTRRRVLPDAYAGLGVCGRWLVRRARAGACTGVEHHCRHIHDAGAWRGCVRGTAVRGAGIGSRSGGSTANCGNRLRHNL